MTAALQEAEISSFESASPLILIMEDDVSLAKGFEMVLSEEGYDVSLAETGQEALNEFGRKAYDLLVADLRLPDIDGMEVIRQVKTGRPETEVVVVTGYGSAETAVDAMKLGVHDFLSKPLTEDQIKAAISDALLTHADVPALNDKAEPAGEKSPLIQKRAVLQVLNRTAEDMEFWKNLMEKGSAALAEYNLSLEAKAAIASGNLKWINENVGELNQKQLMFIYKRLEREAW